MLMPVEFVPETMLAKDILNVLSKNIKVWPLFWMNMEELQEF